MGLRRPALVVVLTVVCVSVLAGAVAVRTAQSAAQYSLDWTMPDRYGDANNDGFADQVYPPDGSATIDPGGWQVDLTVSGANCGATDTRTWWIEGARVTAGDPRLLSATATGCTLSYRFPAEGVYEVALEERDANGALVGSVKRAVTVQDFLIVSIGDSVASGEGNPELTGPRPAWENGSAQGAAQCHRSRYAGPSQAGLALEQADRHSSVTFVHLACSGATALNGLIGAEQPGQGPVTTAQTPQLQQLKSLVGNREIDALTLSVGANDIHFSGLVTECLLLPSCDSRNSQLSSASIFARDVQTLPGIYARLGAALAQAGAQANRVYLSQYFDPTHNDAGAICNKSILNDVGLPPAIFSITAPEATWASQTMLGGINAAGAAAASTNGWNYVGGLAQDFVDHGYCAADHWVVRYSESQRDQRDANGSLHPNHEGQADYGTRIGASLSADLLSNATARRPFQRIRLSGEGPSDGSFGDVVGNVDPNAAVQLRVQLDGKATTGQQVTYSLQGPGSLSTTSGTTDGSGQTAFSYVAPDAGACPDGPVCAVLTATYTDSNGAHSDALTVGVTASKRPGSGNVTLTTGGGTFVESMSAGLQATIETDGSIQVTPSGNYSSTFSDITMINGICVSPPSFTKTFSGTATTARFSGSVGDSDGTLTVDFRGTSSSGTCPGFPPTDPTPDGTELQVPGHMIYDQGGRLLKIDFTSSFPDGDSTSVVSGEIDF